MNIYVYIHINVYMYTAIARGSVYKRYDLAHDQSCIGREIWHVIISWETQWNSLENDL